MTKASKDGDSANDSLERGLVSLGIVVASTLAGAVWVALSVSGSTYNQNLVLGSLLGFLVGITLVLTVLLAAKR